MEGEWEVGAEGLVGVELSESFVLERVGDRGDSLTGDVGESRSFEPDESFVLFFFRNPNVGIEAAFQRMRGGPGRMGMPPTPSSPFSLRIGERKKKRW